MILAVFLAFAAGIALGFLIKGVMAPLPPRSYRTRVALLLQGDRDQPIGELPAGSVIVSKYSLGKSEVGWWGLIPVAFGDGSDATELLSGPFDTQSLISITDMLYVRRKAPPPSAAAAVKPSQNTTKPVQAITNDK
jgi:hypothetical protein